MWQELLRQAATSTFEEAAFCLVEGLEEGSGGSGREIGPARGAVRFEGPRSGLLLVEADSATASSATANMLGLDDAPSAELQRDALFEVANMICGQVVSGAGGDAGLFRLRPAQESASPAAPEAELVLALDCGLARVALWITPPPDGGDA